MKNGFIIYNTQYNPIKGLSLEQKGKLLDRIFYFNNGDNTESGDPVVEMAFGFFKQQFDIDNQKYKETCEINKINAKKGANARWNKNKQKMPNGNERKQSVAKMPDNDNDNDIIINNKKINKKEIIKIEETDDLETRFKKTLGLFIDFRKKIKKPITEEGQQAFQNKLMKLANNDPETAIEILNNSLANGWQGIFEIKENFNNNKQKIGIL